MEIKMYCVYKHTTPSNKVYIGITSQNPIKRWGGGCNYEKQKHFYAAIIKYGWENIKHEILYSNLTKEEACEIEKRLIAQYKSTDRRFGYNESNGGEWGAAGLYGEKNHNFGKHLSEETKQKLRISHLRENISAETLEKMSKANKGRFGVKHWNYGRKYSDEMRKKLSEAHKKCNQKTNAKKVICVETKTVYLSMKKAAEAVNRKQSGITMSIKTGIKCGGFHWEYAREDEQKLVN